ncbi:hypothetical protein D041_3897A, partial [Vibrio parahaemolyticus EKP-008]
MLNFYRTA